MHPAPSVILFTVCSGLGFGLLAFLGLGFPDVGGWVAFIFFLVGYALAVGGLLASSFHLGNPQRALLAFSQWKTSWLSREAWASLVSLTVIGIYALGVVFFDVQLRALGILGAVLCMMTVFITSMIYAQLRTVPRWNHWITIALFLAFSISGGALLSGQSILAGLLLLALGGVMALSWYWGDARFEQRGSGIGTATGLGVIGQVRLLEAPHSGTNYLLREMVHVVGRRHALKLRVISLTCASVLPACLLLALPAGHLVGLLALTLHLVGAFASRWLFFAQAEHVVGLYYGKHG